VLLGGVENDTEDPDYSATAIADRNQRVIEEVLGEYAIAKYAQLVTSV
jgi:hypothetical protein